MRIAFVAPFGLRAKGTTRARVLPLARALADRGHASAVFIPPYDSPEDSGKSWREGLVDVRNVLVPPLDRGARPVAHLLLAFRLWRAVRRWNPDVVHVFKPKGPSGLVGAATWLVGQGRSPAGHRASFMGRRPFLVLDSDDWEGPGGWNDDPRAAYSGLERHLFAWQERYGLSHADSWTVASACLQDRAVCFGADPQRVFVMHNGVPQASLRGSQANGLFDAVQHPGLPAIRGYPSAIVYTRFAGVRAEDIAIIWEAVRAIVPEARLTVLGRGLAGEEETLRNSPGVDVRGWVEPGELPAILAGADVAIVPWADTPSNRARHSAKVLELMAAGLPVVAYSIGELPASLGDAGVLVKSGNHAAYAMAVVSLFRDRELARKLGALARQRALTEFAWEQLAKVAEEAYRSAQTCPTSQTGSGKSQGG